MSADVGVAFEAPEVAAARTRQTLLVGSRLFLAANTMFMFAMLFAYLYLRGNNFGGGWRPDGLAELTTPPMALVLVLQLVCLLVTLGALAAARRGGAARVIAAVALVVGIVAMGARVWFQYNLGDGWTINNGTYTAVSEMWFGALIVEVGLGCIWLLSIAASAKDKAATANHLRAFSEFWAYLLVLSTLVFCLVRFV
jgi:heme/copper-type cytochrome/quinol oxidase subunit 3